MTLLRVTDLQVSIADTPILRDIDLSVDRGEVLGVVGESGSGKSMTALSLMRLLPLGSKALGSVTFDGTQLFSLTEKQMCKTLTKVELPPEQFPLSRFPHELSGGQRQRVVIAMAIALRPKLLIADEPTTALDVTTQAQLLKLLRRLVDEDGMGLILISHDLAVVANTSDHLAVMRDGCAVT